MFGTVTRYFKDKGYGFISGDNGRSYFIHNSKLNGEYIECDYYVFFIPFHNNKGNCAAVAMFFIDLLIILYFLPLCVGVGFITYTLLLLLNT